MLMDKNARKEKYGKAFRHIRKLKDVVELVFQRKKVHGKLKDDGANPPNCWVCPVTSTEMNAKTPFCFLWDTGNVYSVKATKELPSACDNGNILNLIRLAPTGKELDSMRDKLKAEKHQAKSKKMKNRWQCNNNLCYSLYFYACQVIILDYMIYTCTYMCVVRKFSVHDILYLPSTRLPNLLQYFVYIFSRSH